MNKWKYITPGIPDDLFIRGKAPMTKAEIRALVMAKLRLEETSVMVDVGAGTGSVAIEGALYLKKGRVYGIEYRQEALELLKRNIEVFGVDNIEIMAGKAGDQLRLIPFYDRIFIGGSGGELEAIIQLAAAGLPSHGRIVLTAVTVETMSAAMLLLKKYEFNELELVTVNVARGSGRGNYTLMEAQNPITIISAARGKGK